MARISVMEMSQQPTDKPDHFTSRKIAEAIVADRKAVWCGKRRIHLTTKQCWAAIRLSYKEVVIKSRSSNIEVVIPQLVPYDPKEHYCTMLHYPPIDQSSYAKANFARVWETRPGSRWMQI